MNDSIHKTTKLWVMPQFDHLELFRERAIHYHYARHFHSGYSIGVIEAGVGGNYYQGSTYLAPPESFVGWALPTSIYLQRLQGLGELQGLGGHCLQKMHSNSSSGSRYSTTRSR